MHNSVYKIKYHILIILISAFPAVQIEAEPAASVHFVIQRPFKTKSEKLYNTVPYCTVIFFGVVLSQQLVEKAAVCCLLAPVCSTTTPDLLQPVIP
jgi:hypothetical protein